MTDAMQTIRDGLEVLRTGNIMVPMGIYMDGTREMVPKVANHRERGEIADACLTALDSLAVAPDESAKAFAIEIAHEAFDPWFFNKVEKQYMGAFDHDSAAVLIQVHDERIRRECADRAVKWQKRLCTLDDWSCKNCNECEQLEASILTPEATNGQ